ncbi:MAG: hypothetical protein JWN60_590, partial [Acidobacteria bacterium]|nr:hypothetical protein [Acidobacteriota bacterium]
MKKIVSFVLSFVFIFLFAGQAAAQTMPQGADRRVWQQALKLHKKAIVIDGHN